MEYALGCAVFIVLAALLYRMLKFSGADRYTKMSSREFEDEAKRVSPVAGALMAVQKLIDPSHRVEYTQEAKESKEDGANPAEPPGKAE